MTDLRSALKTAAVIIEHMCALADKPVPAIVADLRSLADAPLCVLDALRDPEVRAGRVWPESEHDGGIVNQYRVVHGEIENRWRAEGRPFGRWWQATPSIADLDAPCRLVPAEEP
jgi:hypothetical protein